MLAIRTITCDNNKLCSRFEQLPVRITSQALDMWE